MLQKKNVVIETDDTVVFILLLYYCQAESLTVLVPIKLQSNRAFIGIHTATAHALSDCYSVSVAKAALYTSYH